MASKRALQNVEWDVVDLEWNPTPQERNTQRTVRCVFRKIVGGWEPWVIEAESALLNQVGQRGLGLYAARAFKRDDYIGRYDGQVIGTFESRNAALASAQCRSRVEHGADKLITRLASHGQGVELVDGATSGPPFLPRINDPRGTHFKSNVDLTDGGWIKVTQQRVHAFDLSEKLENNIKAELRLSYGDDYWSIISRMGRTAEYAIHVD